MKKLFFIFILVVTGCNFKDEISEQDKVADTLILKFSRTIHQNNLHFAGLGGAVDHSTGKLKQMAVVYGTKDILSLEKTRELFVDITRSFLSHINKDDEIQKYLNTHPFTIENVNVGIVCENSIPKKMAHISQIEDMVYYYANPLVPDKKTVFTGQIMEETYEEAQRLVDYPNEVHRREVTCIYVDENEEIAWVGGPWGKACKDLVIEQVCDGQMDYYTLCDGEERPLPIDDDQITVRYNPNLEYSGRLPNSIW